MKIVYTDNSESRHLQREIRWAEQALQKPNETFPNGRQLHEVAAETIDKASDKLIDYMCIQVTPKDIH